MELYRGIDWHSTNGYVVVLDSSSSTRSVIALDR